MDDQTRQFIQDEVHRQLKFAIDAMRKALWKKEHERTRTWWRRTLQWVSVKVNEVALAHRRRQWARLSAAERDAHESAWLDRTHAKLYGKPFVIRRLESSAEERESVLASDFVKSILDQPSEPN